MANTLKPRQRKEVAVEFLKGAKISELAKDFKCSRDQIVNIIEDKDINTNWLKEQVEDLEEYTMEKMRLRRLQLLERTNKIVDDADVVVEKRFIDDDLSAKDANQIAKDYFNRSQVLQDKPAQGLETALGVIVFPLKEYLDDKPKSDKPKNIVATIQKASTGSEQD